MPIKSNVFIQTLQKSQDRHEICFAFKFNNKNTKKVFVIVVFWPGQICSSTIQLVEFSQKSGSRLKNRSLER